MSPQGAEISMPAQAPPATQEAPRQEGGGPGDARVHQQVPEPAELRVRQHEQRTAAAVDDQQAAGDCARDVVAGPAGRHQQAGDNGPERTLVQLDLDGFDYDDDASFAKKQPRHPRQKPKKTKLFSGDKDPSTVLAALGIPSDGEGDRNDGPPISRKSIKMNTKRKKGTRNMFKNFQFETIIFDSSGSSGFGPRLTGSNELPSLTGASHFRILRSRTPDAAATSATDAPP
nr:hypothetical protein PF009_g23768 [Phytophthora fragariae]